MIKYSKTCQNGYSREVLRVCFPVEHSARLSTCIKLQSSLRPVLGPFLSGHLRQVLLSDMHSFLTCEYLGTILQLNKKNLMPFLVEIEFSLVILSGLLLLLTFFQSEFADKTKSQCYINSIFMLNLPQLILIL